MKLAAIGVYVEEDRFRIRIKVEPQSAWQDCLDGRTYTLWEALDTLTSLGIERSRAEQMIGVALSRGTSARTTRKPTALPCRCPSCDVPALAREPKRIGYFCLSCGFASDEAN